MSPELYRRACEEIAAGHVELQRALDQGVSTAAEREAFDRKLANLARRRDAARRAHEERLLLDQAHLIARKAQRIVDDGAELGRRVDFCEAVTQAHRTVSGP